MTVMYASGGCAVEGISEEEQKLARFTEMIDSDAELEMYGIEYADDGDSIVLHDTSKAEGESGVYIRVSVKEVLGKPLGCIMAVIKSERKPIVLEGVTRIVGYYSRTNNWNKSKVGELRDRARGDYGSPGYRQKHQAERLAAINSA